MRILIISLLAIVAIYLGYNHVAPYGMDKAIVISVTIFAAIFWITEVIPLAITALFIPIILIVGGVFTLPDGISAFFHPVLFLMFGGYAMAVAIERNGVARWIMYKILRLSGHHQFSILGALMISSAVLSMFISNTAAVALLIPMVMHFLSILGDEASEGFVKKLMLGIAYSASIGGVATLIGSPPNAIAAGILNISFSEWLGYGMPVSIIMLLFTFITLRFWGGRHSMDRSFSITVTEETKLSVNGKKTLVIMSVVLFFWLFGPLVEDFLALPSKLLSATNVACSGVVLLMLWGCLRLGEIQSGVKWFVLILIGGGLTLGQGLISTGTSTWLAGILADQVQGLNPVILLLVMVTVAIFATELISNTAVAANLVPILTGLAVQMHIPEADIAVPVAIATSMAFMLPVATPPNALIYASGYVTQREMMKVGVWLNVLAIIVLTTWFSIL